jgi:hypothetical protein
VSSAPGQGSTSWVRLPITLASAQDQRAAA